MMTKPSDQFQINEPVLYVPEGVITKIDGYVWMTPVEGPSRIIRYRPSCGINATKEDLGKRVHRHD